MTLQRIDVAFDQGFGQRLCRFEAGVFVHLHPGLLRIANLSDKGQLRLVEAAGYLGGTPVGVAFLDLIGREVGLWLRTGQRCVRLSVFMVLG